MMHSVLVTSLTHQPVREYYKSNMHLILFYSAHQSNSCCFCVDEKGQVKWLTSTIIAPLTIHYKSQTIIQSAFRPTRRACIWANMYWAKCRETPRKGQLVWVYTKDRKLCRQFTWLACFKAVGGNSHQAASLNSVHRVIWLMENKSVFWPQQHREHCERYRHSPWMTDIDDCI